MRKIFGIIAIMALFVFSCNQNKTQKDKPKQDNKVVDTHNARNSLDYYGEYEGVIPCADCPGIKLSITLKKGDEYKMDYVYQDKENGTHSESGKFTWDETNTKITLKNAPFEKYMVAENKLILLDGTGNIITGELADLYVLKKIK